jgi:hypothetical protein
MAWQMMKVENLLGCEENRATVVIWVLQLETDDANGQ